MTNFWLRNIEIEETPIEDVWLYIFQKSIAIFPLGQYGDKLQKNRERIIKDWNVSTWNQDALTKIDFFEVEKQPKQDVKPIHGIFKTWKMNRDRE